MAYDNCSVNRAKLVDEPIVEMILSRKYLKSGLKFVIADLQTDFDGTDIICYSSGTKRSINVKRNSSKYYRSSNFTITLDQNKLNAFNNTSFVFIDEVADCLYMVDGAALLQFILFRSDLIQQSKNNPKKSWVILPKKNIIALIGDNPNGIIKYNKQIAKLLENGRDESQFKDLV